MRRPSGPYGRRTPSVRTVVRRLQKAYGKRPWEARGAARSPALRDRPLDTLVLTLLSQNTTGKNTRAAFARLRAAYRTWDAVADAPPARLADAIRPAGLHHQKARHLQAILRTIRRDRGRLSLNFLRRWPTDRVREFLSTLPGVGPKTAACVLLFGLGRAVLPVDTHVCRVSRRLGLIDARTDAEKAHVVLAEKVPADLVYGFHVLLIEHGRRVCRARRPNCPACVLERLCPSAPRKKGKRGGGSNFPCTAPTANL